LIIERVTESARERMFIRKREQMKQKFKLLMKERNESQFRYIKQRRLKDVVLDLGPEKMPSHHEELLSLGPQFVPAPKQIPFMDIICVAEASALKLQYGQKVKEAEELRQNVMKTLQRAPKIRTNLNRNQRQALREIRSDKNIRIYPFDKGNGFVRIDAKTAIEKEIQEMPSSDVCKIDPTPSIVLKVQRILRLLKKQGKLSKSEYARLYPPDAVAPSMYGSIKAHKPEKNFPMRMIVSTLHTASYTLAMYLTQLIQPTLNKNKTRIKNTQSFVSEAKLWEIDPMEIQVSFDVQNLYPSIPISKSIKVVTQMLSNDKESAGRSKLTNADIKKLLELCLSTNYYRWGEEIRIANNNSGPIGLSLMVVMAEAYLQNLEEKALLEAANNNVIVKSYRRYVDDSHGRFKSIQEAEMFKEILNRQDPAIIYTMEMESEQGQLNFLDVTIINSRLGHYLFKIYRKPAITNVQIKPNSCVDPRVAKATFLGFLSRAEKLCSHQFIQDEVDFLLDNFTENGHNRNDLEVIVNKRKYRQPHLKDSNQEKQHEQQPIAVLPWIPGISPKLRKQFRKSGVKAVFRSQANLKMLLTYANKPNLPRNSTPGVYELQCSCGKKYVGETSLRASTRINQHKKNVFAGNWCDSGLSEHARTCPGQIDWASAKVIKCDKQKFSRKVRESLEIQYRKTGPASDTGMNRDNGNYVTTTFWEPLFEKLRQSDVINRRFQQNTNN
jgi:hypothetical protein